MDRFASLLFRISFAFSSLSHSYSLLSLSHRFPIACHCFRVACTFSLLPYCLPIDFTVASLPNSIRIAFVSLFHHFFIAVSLFSCCFLIVLHCSHFASLSESVSHRLCIASAFSLPCFYFPSLSESLSKLFSHRFCIASKSLSYRCTVLSLSAMH
jgi:hypothetical protein